MKPDDQKTSIPRKRPTAKELSVEPGHLEGWESGLPNLRVLSEAELEEFGLNDSEDWVLSPLPRNRKMRPPKD